MVVSLLLLGGVSFRPPPFLGGIDLGRAVVLSFFGWVLLPLVGC